MMARILLQTRGSVLSLAPTMFATLSLSTLRLHITRHTCTKIRIGMRNKEQMPMDTLCQRTPSRSRTTLRRGNQNRRLVTAGRNAVNRYRFVHRYPCLDLRHHYKWRGDTLLDVYAS